ncbi:MAG: nuclear transport factor 2 family protein [Gemmatimonadales bacterium]
MRLSAPWLYRNHDGKQDLSRDLTRCTRARPHGAGSRRSRFRGARGEANSTRGAREAATMAADVAFLDSVYADDFRFKHSTGLLETKEEVLAARRQDAGTMLSRDLDSLDIEIHGDIALSTGRIHVHTTFETTKWREYTIRYVRSYVRRHGRWRLVSHHSTGESFGPLDGRD